jgi:hypothetical protein
MAKKDGVIEVEGSVVPKSLPNAMFPRELANGHLVLAHYLGQDVGSTTSDPARGPGGGRNSARTT